MAAKPESFDALIAQALATVGDASTRADVAVWLALLEEWNARIDLTAARSPEEFVDLMLADAVVLAAHVPAEASLVDVGTGAGGPGLALALLRRDLHVTLVEPLAKRASFLRTVLGTLGRSDIAIERSRAESLDPARHWDVAISRATLQPPVWLDLAARLIAPGGSIWVLVAGEEPPIHDRAEVESDYAYVWPLTGARRRAIVYRLRP